MSALPGIRHVSDGCPSCEEILRFSADELAWTRTLNARGSGHRWTAAVGPYRLWVTGSDRLSYRAGARDGNHRTLGEYPKCSTLDEAKARAITVAVIDAQHDWLSHLWKCLMVQRRNDPAAQS